jgi:hypothetical protein
MREDSLASGFMATAAEPWEPGVWDLMRSKILNTATHYVWNIIQKLVITNTKIWSFFILTETKNRFIVINNKL